MIDPCAAFRLLRSLTIANQAGQWEEGTNGNVLVVHQVFFRQRQCVHDGVGIVNGPHANNKNHASAVTPRVPLANLAVEVELHGSPDLGRHDLYDLLTVHSLFGSQYDHDFRGLR
jgi:hypothetical protein